MQIKVEISEELAGRAKDQGVPVESYVQSLLQERVAGESQPQSVRTPEEMAAFFRAMAEGSEQLPQLPTESFTRSSFYEER
jgi:hypothetical protein